MQSNRFIFKIAPYVDAIEAERKKGHTWVEIADHLGVIPATLSYSVRRRPFDVPQIPLPEKPIDLSKGGES
jgi:hypothetical protein